MERLNYGLAVSDNGSYQVVDTWYAPGIRDDWSENRGESFTFFVAPHEYIDTLLNTSDQEDYQSARRTLMTVFSESFRVAILTYFGFNDTRTNECDFPDDPDTEWEIRNA